MQDPWWIVRSACGTCVCHIDCGAPVSLPDWDCVLLYASRHDKVQTNMLERFFWNQQSIWKGGLSRRPGQWCLLSSALYLCYGVNIHCFCETGRLPEGWGSYSKQPASTSTWQNTAMTPCWSELSWTGDVKKQFCIHTYVNICKGNTWQGDLFMGEVNPYGFIQSLTLDRAQVYIFYLNNLRLKTFSVELHCRQHISHIQVHQNMSSRKKQKQLHLNFFWNKMSLKLIHIIKTGKHPLWVTSCGMSLWVNWQTGLYCLSFIHCFRLSALVRNSSMQCGCGKVACFGIIMGPCVFLRFVWRVRQ